MQVGNKNTNLFKTEAETTLCDFLSNFIFFSIQTYDRGYLRARDF